MAPPLTWALCCIGLLHLVAGNEQVARHQVVIKVNKLVGGRMESNHHCSGVIIEPRFILSTGKCVQELENILADSSQSNSSIYIMAGHLQQNNASMAINITVDELFVHHKFNNQSLAHDIGLIRIAETLPANFALKITDIDNPDRLNCTTVIVDRSGTATDGLFETGSGFPIIDYDTCNRTLNYTSTREDDLCSLYHTSTNWCGTSMESERLNPDLGAMLVCNNMLVGVLSEITVLKDGLSPCGMRRKSCAVYTSVYECREWISTKTGKQYPDEPDKALRLSSAAAFVAGTVLMGLLL